MRQPCRHFNGRSGRLTRGVCRCAVAAILQRVAAALVRLPVEEGATLLFRLLRRRAGTKRKRPPGKRLLAVDGRPRRLNGEELESYLEAPVLLEEARALDRDLDVVADLGLVRVAGEGRRQCAGDVLQEQLLAPVHDAHAAHAKQAAAGAEAADAGEPADAGHGHGVAAGVVDGQLELEGELVLAGLQGEGAVGVAGAGVVLVWEDLLDLVEDLVVLADDAAGGAGHGAGRAAGAIVVGVGDLEGGDGLALELDDDAADLLGAVEGEDDAAGDVVEVGVEFGLVVERYADGHGGRWGRRQTLPRRMADGPWSTDGRTGLGRARSRGQEKEELRSLIVSATCSPPQGAWQGPGSGPWGSLGCVGIQEQEQE